MNYKLTSAVAFVTGAAIGSLVTWKLLKDRYERIVQEEIESVKEVFSRKTESLDDSEESFEEIPSHRQAKESSIMEYAAKLKEMQYSDEEDVEKGVDEQMSKIDKPYVIEPDEFGELDYETVSLTYYADGVLTDDRDNIIEDMDGIVGNDAVNHFGEFEEDSVFVRNDSKQCDYEILRVYEEYRDIYPESTED